LPSRESLFDSSSSSYYSWAVKCERIIKHCRAADLEGTTANPEHLAKLLKEGVESWGQWRKQNSEVLPDLSGAHLSGADLSRANLSAADLSRAILSRATLVDTNLEGANLTDCSVYGVSAWNVRLEGAVQSSLVITPWGESPIQVDNLEVAQFIYLLLSRQKLRSVITTIGEKAVLILGRFTERKELLDRMADKLRLLGYIPMIFDFDRPTDRDLTETVKILAGLSRFVIADITNPRSVPLELQATVPDYMVPFVTILQRGQPAFGMFDDLSRKYHWALPLLEYNNADTLLAAFEHKVVAPALKKVAQVRKKKAASPRRRSAEEC
jgi:hypothetical protein